MATDVIIPALGESITEATVGQWLKAPGDAVAVVKFGVGRARRFQAFPIPSGRALHEGDTVVVHAGRCLLKDSTSAA